MINIFDLNKSRDEKEINKYKTYREILKKCHSKIKLVSKESYNSNGDNTQNQSNHYHCQCHLTESQ